MTIEEYAELLYLRRVVDGIRQETEHWDASSKDERTDTKWDKGYNAALRSCLYDVRQHLPRKEGT